MDSAAPDARTAIAPRASRIAVLATLALAGALAACGGADGGGGGRSVLLVTLDTTRADHLSCYGYPQEITPVLDGLAERGVLFDRAYAPMGQTLPSHATLFTGLWPREHGALENHFLLGGDVTTLAEDLAGRGYVTAGVVGTRVLDADTGIAQGIDQWDEDDMRREGGKKFAERKADEVVDRTLAWADRLVDAGDGDRPYFLWVHFFDPHLPFEAPAEFREQIDDDAVAELVADMRPRFRRVGEEAGTDPMPRMIDYWADYAAEVRFTDHQLGRLLDGLDARGLMDDTVVIVVGDHGEGLLEHGVRTHGVSLFDEVMRVPLIIAAPDGELAGTRVDEPVSIRDVRATVASLAAADGGSGGAGSGGAREGDLWGELRARGAVRPRPVILERPHYADQTLVGRTNSFYTEGRMPGEMLAVVAEGHKLVMNPDGERWLFDLSPDDADPSREFVDVSAERPELAARLGALLEAWIAAHPVLHDAGSQELSTERLEMLEQLGYGR